MGGGTVLLSCVDLWDSPNSFLGIHPIPMPTNIHLRLPLVHIRVNVGHYSTFFGATVLAEVASGFSLGFFLSFFREYLWIRFSDLCILSQYITVGSIMDK